MKKVFIASTLIVVAVAVSVIAIFNPSDAAYGDFKELLVDNDEQLCEINDTITIEEALGISACLNLQDIEKSVFPKAFKNKSGNIYTVYDVENYGKLYLTYDTNSNKPQISSFFVIPKTKTDFQKLTIGQSTFNDVCNIDPCAEYLTGNLNKSYHLLPDGTVITIKYDTENNSDNLADSVAEEIEFDNNIQYNSEFYDEDKPFSGI